MNFADCQQAESVTHRGIPYKPERGRLLTMIVTVIFCTLVFLSVLAASAAQTEVFLCELHYDNDGADAGEVVEICGPAGTDLSGWSIALYNGNGGTVYTTITLSGVIDDLANGFGVSDFAQAGIQNGAPDGLALVNAGSDVVQFLSYEGTLTATDGPAIGMVSADIGVAEGASTSAGTSLQLTGIGSTYEDFAWEAEVAASFGTINAGMLFGSCGVSIPPTSPTEPIETPAPTPSTTLPTEPIGVLCEVTPRAISNVQGSGTETPLDGTIVTIRGIVTAVFSGLEGFYLQDGGDGDTSTSDGVFVYLASDPTLSVGDEVAVRGTASEYFGNTQVSATAAPEVCRTGATLPRPVSVVLPSDQVTLESLEGMLVSIKRPVVTENYNADSFGEIVLAAGRQWQFTQINAPGTVPDVPVGTTLIFDDGATGRNPNPDTYVDQASDVRVGQTLRDVEGIMTYGFSAYRVQPTTSGVTLGAATNPRPTEVPTRDRVNARVASFNVLNYFTTLGSRGAETVQQREDQLAKITAGALALHADVIALIEVENDYAAAKPSIQVIVDSINAQDSRAEWTYVVPTTIPLGSDAIAVGLIYDATKVSLKGGCDVLVYGDDKTRASLAQTFSTVCSTRECPAFTVVANHFKSKGSACDDLGDPNANDGQGNCNLTRVAAMRALLAWVTGPDITVAPDEDILLAGDFNAYAQEDPIQTAASAGYVDLSIFDSDYPFVSSYIFAGESGTLDYILASASAASQRRDTLVHYQVNADEPAGLEYDNCGANDACLVSLDQYRCSDHDMAVQDFNFI